jgi:hypothetical protein
MSVCSLASPVDWDPIISEKKVSYIALSETTPALIREELIHDKLEQLERESLLKKVDLPFRLCSPPASFAPINNYAYDRDRLEKIDVTRQAIIHKDGLGKPVASLTPILSSFQRPPTISWRSLTKNMAFSSTS